MTASSPSRSARSSNASAARPRGKPRRGSKKRRWNEGFYAALPLLVVGPACLLAGALLYATGAAAALSWGGFYHLRLWVVYLVLGLVGMVLAILAFFVGAAAVASGEARAVRAWAPPVASVSQSVPSPPVAAPSPAAAKPAAWDESTGESKDKPENWDWSWPENTEPSKDSAPKSTSDRPIPFAEWMRSKVRLEITPREPEEVGAGRDAGPVPPGYRRPDGRPRPPGSR